MFKKFKIIRGMGPLNLLIYTSDYHDSLESIDSHDFHESLPTADKIHPAFSKPQTHALGRD